MGLKHTERNQRVVMVPCPYQGHINPMLQLAKALHSRGFSITIAHTVINSPNESHHPEFTFVAFSAGLSLSDFIASDPVSNMLAINDNCGAAFKACLQGVIGKTLSEGEVIACVIADELMFFAEDVAVEMKIPMAILRTTSAATSFARLGLIRLVQHGCLVQQDMLPHEIVPELDPLRYKDLPISLNYNPERFSKLFTRMYGERKCSATLWNTANCLEELLLEKIQTQYQIPIFSIGPLHMIAPSISSSLIDEDKSCISWLNKQSCGSVIYVSCMGSVASLSEKEVVNIAWGLANSKQPFLWVIRPVSVCGSDWIEWLPQGFQDSVGERGVIVKWAPQKEVLAHCAVGGFWSHCGWNSTLESLAEGVPLICKPCFSDQKVNTRYISYVWRVGLELEELESGEIESAIRRLILSDEGNQIRARAKALKHKIQASTRKGGSSYDSFDEFVDFIMSR